MSRLERAGSRVLALLAEDRMIAALRALADGPLRPEQLERELGVAHSVMFERLKHLLDLGALSYERRAGTPPHGGSAGVPQRALYGLRDAGRALLEVPAQGERWEKSWRAPRERADGSGSVAIALLADRHTREILLALADGALRTAEVGARALSLGRSALRRRLRDLVLAEMLEAHELGRTRRYELTCSARHLAAVALAAARWEWSWWRREQSHTAGADLGDLLRMIAPAARLPQTVAGVCQLHVQAAGDDTADIYLAAHAGALRAVSANPPPAPQAVGSATPQQWSDALLDGERLPAAVGDRQLLTNVSDALRTALLA